MDKKEFEETLADAVASIADCDILPDIKEIDDGYRIDMPFEIEYLSNLADYVNVGLTNPKEAIIALDGKGFEVYGFISIKDKPCAMNNDTLSVYLKES